ncbi:MAG: AAA family ATPase [Opitutaceae bacterium]
MRLVSILIRNYRLHKEIRIEFDPARTLVGGRNESGKSTIIEAVHRALFLKAKGNTEYHKAMVSTLHVGHPEVELTFETAGVRYIVRKRFGTNGSTTLAPSNSETLNGEGAEAELARVLNVEAGVGGKTMASQWAHLWVWQGKACDDPSSHASANVGGLLQRLQQMGGGGALQSERDAQVASYFSGLQNSIYTNSGRPKAGSALEIAESSAAEAQERLRIAIERIQRLESAADDLETATKTVISSEATIEGLQLERDRTDAREKKIQIERQHESEHSNSARTAREQCAAIESANLDIASAQSDILSLKEGLKPKQEAIARLEVLLATAKAEAAAAENEARKAAVVARKARLAYELAGLRIQLIERSEILRKLTEKAGKVAKMRSALAASEKEMSKLPVLDRSKLNKIQKLESEVSRSHAALEAIATAVEVISANKPVKIGGKEILPGERRILTQESEIVAGTSLRLRVQPGGGTTLGDARKAKDEAEKDLRGLLDSLGLASPKDAIEIGAQREDLAGRIKTTRAEIAAMDAEDIDRELEVARNNLTTSRAEVERHEALVEETKAPADIEAAEESAKVLKRLLREAEGYEAEANGAKDVASKSLQRAEQALAAAKDDSAQQKMSLGRREAQLEILLRNHGDDASRNKKLSELKAARIAAETLLAATVAAINELQPDLIEDDKVRIERAIKAATDEQNDARSRIAVAKAALRSDGSEDPATELATARARAHSAEEERVSQVRHAKAIALLDMLFREEQRGLAERFTKPLADRISGYLRCIFGPEAGVQLRLEDNEFTGLRLLRPKFGNSPFAFDALSGGAKEQTAAAYRLAMAEVLAADYDGCLPVVFDDAFAYSDPERVGEMQRMLNLAANRGLQVIILTCNPADYASLGAKLVTLRSESYLQGQMNSRATGVVGGFPNEPVDHSPTPSEEGSVNSAIEVTDELRKTLLEGLLSLGGSSGNGSLREKLDWDEATYIAVKGDLLAAGRLQSGRGRGGSVSLSPN